MELMTFTFSNKIDYENTSMGDFQTFANYVSWCILMYKYNNI